MALPGTRKTKFQTFFIDVSQPVADKVIDPFSMERYLKERIKVDGKLNNLGENVVVRLNGSRLVVQARPPFSKRYLKYLTKKYLKKQDIRDYLRVVSVPGGGYEVRYFKLAASSE
eukprot:PLAT11091.1.p1 GENE.PLAT11091.1~~PLAT11091.1.p1  ORF type:complete len:115 (+),score=43.30 PLAT11091.1:105-449(+)